MLQLYIQLKLWYENYLNLFPKHSYFYAASQVNTQSLIFVPHEFLACGNTNLFIYSEMCLFSFMYTKSGMENFVSFS
jgi:hypothetical protein